MDRTALRSSDGGSWYSIAVIGAVYAAIAAIALLAERYGGWPARLVALPLVAALQNHLQILHHEGAHYHLHPRRGWNDLLSDLFCALPFFGLTAHYRRFHFEHHRHLLDPARDPEVGFYAEQGYHYAPLRRRSALRLLALDLCGAHYAQFFVSYNRFLWQEIRARRLPALALRDGVLAALVLAAALLLCAGPCDAWQIAFYWLLPQPTFLFLFLKLQGYGEHAARGRTIEESTFTYDAPWLVRLFIYPLRSELHLEHHLKPSLPWYALEPIRPRPLPLPPPIAAR